MTVREMTERASRELLGRSHMAHLGCVRDYHPYVVPVNFACDEEKLYAFSLMGQKIEWMRSNPSACVQVDEAAERQLWKSVVVVGRYQELPDTPQWHNERIYAWSLLQKRSLWWEPASSRTGSGSQQSETPIFFSISIDEISGRELVAS
jgi:nitroimidazol reductase NimA-like FMN-containing flavoprotein (pyridoxamine 5'-phosphate oxidase superfamily)